MKELPSERIQDLLKTIVKHYDGEDRTVRERQIRQWKKLKLLWDGFSRIYWSETARDYRLAGTNDNAASNDAAFYDKSINVFKAYIESLIAALSESIPSINCAPDDADNSLDLATARAGDKISELIYKHNDVVLLWFHALFIHYTEGLVFAYNYSKEDEKYGTYQEPKYENVEESSIHPFCPTCNNQLDNMGMEGEEEREDEYDPSGSEEKYCTNCEANVNPEQRPTKLIVNRLTGFTNRPKARQCIEVYGGLFVKISNYVMRQEDLPYLQFNYESHYAAVIDRYPHLRDKYTKESKIGPSTAGSYDPYERWGRLSTQYYGEYPLNNTTIKTTWIRPSSFNILNDEDDIKELKRLYKDGIKIVQVNDEFAEAINENLDDHWTLTRNPLADYLHHDPGGMLLVGIQEMTNDLNSLVLQTIEHGIPQTFADPNVLNFDQYKQVEATPGMIFPATPKSGKNIGESFYEVRTASLSAEIQPFRQSIQEMAQLVSGALPSLFGGAAPNSSKTAAQYAMSRAQALQRLQIPWKMLTIWWKNIFAKVIPAYIKDVIEQGTDERLVQKDEQGNFVNVYIRKAELQGKIGSVELEASEQLPLTWGQKKDALMQLFGLNNPEIMQALLNPENIPLIAQAIGLDDFSIAGQDDREKQYEEIKILLQSEPMPSPQGPSIPSVDVEPFVDNHAVEAEICRKWLIGDAGRLAKIENPNGYQNVLLHMKRHIDIMHVMSSPAPDNLNQNPNQNAAQPQGKSNGSIGKQRQSEQSTVQ